LELATVYLEGGDVPKEETLGLTLLRRAADHGLPRAQFLMGERVYAHGGDSADYVQAYAWYELARPGRIQGQ